MWVSVEIRLTFWHDRRYRKPGDVIQPLILSLIQSDRNCSPFSEYGTKILFLPMERWSDSAVLVTDRHVILQFLERKNLWLRTCDGFTCSYVVQTKICRILLPSYRN